mgnify:CR=1 FL=1|jgi:hypothetical protein|tara:strand:+ start:19050 stop:19364 length:315 start_codon:yes stop_codon:yes gene_type:complete
MRVRPLGNYKLLGTEIGLDKTKVYDAVLATNQPNYQELGLIFVNFGVKAYHGMFANFSMLLNKDEYTTNMRWEESPIGPIEYIDKSVYLLAWKTLSTKYNDGVY